VVLCGFSSMRKDLLIMLAASVLLVLGLSGCATLHKGSHQRIPVESEPEGATVFVNNERLGTTPVVVPLSRRMGHVVRVEKRGFDAEQVLLYTVPNETEQAFLRFSTDNFTGALNDLDPSEVIVELRPRLLPANPGEDPETEKEEKLAQAAEQRRQGRFSAADYEYVVRRIEEFYSQ